MNQNKTPTFENIYICDNGDHYEEKEPFFKSLLLLGLIYRIDVKPFKDENDNMKIKIQLFS